jgi:YjbE family integral membrane protein
LDWSALVSFFSVLAIDTTLAVDNAVVMGAIAAKLPVHLKRKAIFIGVCAAALFRILFASFAMKLFSIIGLTLAGGILLLWVAWKLWRELRSPPEDQVETQKPPHSILLRQAVWQILLADISMSLDNTLAVTGAARDHFWILVFGLSASVLLMGIAANLLADLIRRHRWISYVGLVIVVYVSLSMIWEGGHQVLTIHP